MNVHTQVHVGPLGSRFRFSLEKHRITLSISVLCRHSDGKSGGEAERRRDPLCRPCFSFRSGPCLASPAALTDGKPRRDIHTSQMTVHQKEGVAASKGLSEREAHP